MDWSAIEKQIEYDWGGNTTRLFACHKLIEVIKKSPAGMPSHMTYGYMYRLLENRLDLKELNRVLFYLASPSIDVLKMNFQLLDEYGHFELSEQDMQLISSTGELIHPDTGEKVDDYESKVHPYFSPSDSVRTLQSGNSGNSR